MVEFTLWDMVRNLLLAARWTILLSLIAFVGGGIAGTFVALARTSRSGAARRLAAVFVEVFQGVPLLVLLFLAYFGLPLVGVDTSALTAAALALTLYAGAYLGETWRGCIEAVPHGQTEASESLGLSRGEALLHVVLPQALKVAVAPTVGFLVQIVKGTALASVIGFVEVTKAGGMISNATLRPLTVYGLVGAAYFLLCYPISLAARALERRLDGPGR